MWRSWWTTGKVIVAILSGIAVLAVQIATLILLLRGGR